MTVRRRREVSFQKDITIVFKHVKNVLRENQLYQNIRTNEEGHIATTRITPGFPLLSTLMNIQLGKEEGQTITYIETISQPFILGDIFDMYNGYIRDFIQDLIWRVQSDTSSGQANNLQVKIQDRVSLAAILRERRAAGQTVVFTNGCFDLLHLGHVRYLQEARSLGDLLVVGLNSDDSARALKGPNRPLVPQNERAEVLAALACVDYVTIFEESTAVALVETLRPDVYVKGGDYAAPAAEGATQPAAINYAKLPEAAPVLAAGGQVRLISYVPGHSTTELIERIVTRFGGGAGGY